MSAMERAREIVGTCRCNSAYEQRGLEDPNCLWHRYGEEIAAALEAERRAALEEAAKVVEAMSRTSVYGTDPRDGSATPLVASKYVAAAIRALGEGGHE